MHAPRELTFKAADGAELFYRAWLPERATPDKAVLLFHRGHEHSGRWQQTVDALNLGDDGFAIFAWDQRGHGRSPGERGHAPDVATIAKDADLFARHVCATHKIAIENVAVVGHSVGAVIAAAWVHDYAPRIRSLVLATPAFRVKLYFPLAVPALRLKKHTIGSGTVKSYVRAAMLTHDADAAHAYEADSQVFRQISVDLLLDLHDTSTRLMSDAAAITTPTLVLAAEKDWIVKLGAQQKFFRNLGSPIKQFEVLRGFHHAVFHERERQIVVDKVRGFIKDSFVRPWHHNGLLESDKGSFTRTEYDLLRGPARDLRWPIVRAGMKTGGRLSQGIRLGWRSGFDSGLTLDYVYENKPRGLTPIGRCVDWFYLNSIGWRGIRIRRANLARTLCQCMRDAHVAGQPVRIVDIAAGPGRYVLEAIKELADVPSAALLRDYQQPNLDAAEELAQALGVRDAVTLARADAFDRTSLASIAPRPTIAIVSGLFELIPDNDRVLRALCGLADAMDAGAHLIYTNQPWHPQVEFIARALVNREGQPWIMRRRSQAEMDELVRVAGFEKRNQEIDQWGIFTVSLARRTTGTPAPTT